MIKHKGHNGHEGVKKDSTLCTHLRLHVICLANHASVVSFVFRLLIQANKNSQSTTALNHCVDCTLVKQSRRLTKSELEGGGSQISFVA
jgi:hypothetical protein